MELYPAIQGKLGSWTYYSTKMTAKSLAANVKFASQVWGKEALDLWIQRTLDEGRAKNSIASYLANQPDRFFNSIVVAALEGNPQFFPVDLADDPRFEVISDPKLLDAFGVLRFDGTQTYYALDGQHRLRGLQALLGNETGFTAPKDLPEEEFSVLIVVPRTSETRSEFLKKYRRLFSHLNRYAKPMDTATSIILEEDDALAIVTRRLIADHEFFSWVGEDEKTCIRAKKPENMHVGEPFFTSIEALYRGTSNLLLANHRKTADGWGTGTDKNIVKAFIRFRPEEEMIDALYQELCLYWDVLLAEIPDLRADPLLMRTDVSAEEELEDGSGVRSNHFLFRPIGLALLTKLVRDKLDQDLANPKEPTRAGVKKALRGFGGLSWRLFQAPWRHLVWVYDPDPIRDRWRMRSQDRKDAVKVGEKILRWICGIDRHTGQTLKGLRLEWEKWLFNCPDEEKNENWKLIEQQATSFSRAQT